MKMGVAVLVVAFLAAGCGFGNGVRQMTTLQAVPEGAPELSAASQSPPASPSPFPQMYTLVCVGVAEPHS
jgi:hypothetical protein